MEQNMESNEGVETKATEYIKPIATVLKDAFERAGWKPNPEDEETYCNDGTAD